jgi:hypothetical protein
VNEPSLFDALADVDRFPIPSVERKLCPADCEWIELVADIGVPADLSTVGHACELLVLLWRERSTWLGLVDELLESMEAA